MILAEAERESQILRGEGDAEANRISREAYGRDPEFYAFYRAMQAYREALGDSDTSMVLSPDSEFFRFFGEIAQDQQAAARRRPSDAPGPRARLRPSRTVPP